MNITKEPALTEPTPEQSADNSAAGGSPLAGQALAKALADILSRAALTWGCQPAADCKVTLVLQLDRSVADDLSALMAERLPHQPPPAKPASPSAPALKVLVAEDDTTSRELVRQVLAKEPRYEMVEAHNGRRAWELMNGGLVPNACILDLNMPEMDGLELLERMRADDRFKKTPVIICTAVKDGDVVKRAAPLQVSYYLLKPYSADRLLSQLAKVLAGQNLTFA